MQKTLMPFEQSDTSAFAVRVNDFIKNSGIPRLTKTIPASDSGTTPTVSVVHGAREESSAGPIFAPMISAGIITEGGLVDRSTAARFDSKLAEQLNGAERYLYGRLTQGGELSKRKAKSKSQTQSVSQSHSVSDDELERFVEVFDRELTRLLGKEQARRQRQLDRDLEAVV